ncbi:PNGase F N-terminal domain-containing protein [Carboxylicivirga sp. N1Y90]|uniref:PNGase F N-terminal domain-containing protein n=1 Tax=Carboxylicivirga fragile TaxID=3417571 RepID=UPI003D338C1B|nr:hypothetical protein [Marinilabiliaceae bacterium N1Y90]
MKGALVFISFLVLLVSCGPKQLPSMGNKTISIFDNEHLFFGSGEFDTAVDLNTDDVVRIMSGRILLKKVQLPNYQRDVSTNLRITLASAGDRWDKSGSCFVLSNSDLKNFISFHNKTDSLADAAPGLENLKGIVSEEGYSPVVELMRFMTPFGIGFYNEQMDNRKPVYIPHWEKEVHWDEDVSDCLSLLEGEVWIGIWVDTWTKEGYSVSAELVFEESPCQYLAKTETQVLPLLNTIPYVNGQVHADIFSRKDLVFEAQIPEGVKNLRLKYITTGHGGHSGGDEFVPCQNIIKIDGKEVLNMLPWRDDCASFRRFNPGSGVWLITDTAAYIDWNKGKYAEKVIEERLASSDLSRSNWCPGSMVDPYEVALDLPAGIHQFTISIPDAQPIDENEMNHWLVSAYLVWDK